MPLREMFPSIGTFDGTCVSVTKTEGDDPSSRLSPERATHEWIMRVGIVLMRWIKYVVSLDYKLLVPLHPGLYPIPCEECSLSLLDATDKVESPPSPELHVLWHELVLVVTENIRLVSVPDLCHVLDNSH